MPIQLWIDQHYLSLPELDQAAIFARLMNWPGKTYRSVKTRHTVAVNHQGQTFYIKRHWGIGFKESLKELSQGKWPIWGAYNEYRALKLLHQNHIPAPRAVAFGRKGFCLPYQQSVVAMTEVGSAVNLEDKLYEWFNHPPKLHYKRYLIKQVAYLARRIHNLGLNHRDFYICHFILSDSQADKPTLYVIDWHRAQKRRSVPKRWLVKDLAGLYFSTLDYPLTRTDRACFLSHYFNCSFKNVIKQYSQLLQQIDCKARQLYDKENGLSA